MAVPILPPLLLDGDRLTREEFLRRWEQMPELKFAELIDGIVCMPSPVSKPHSDFQLRLSYWFGCYMSATPGCSGGVSGTVLMSENSVPQPDLALVINPECGGQSREEGQYAAGAPELIVEVSHTTSARDKGAKLRLYERSGVREYLTVQPKPQEIIWRELVEGVYREMAPGNDGIFRSQAFPGLWLDTAALWAADLPRIAEVVQQGVATPEHAEFVQRLAASKR
ncbi:MAG TPA: Uma2 family endonuclease [Bryobacteraceae bacterium]|nr:Uma2 family endonuclease [Bryobacteraceae bacterium]